MAYENRNAAYDLSLFDDELTYSSAAPKRKHDDEPVKRSRKKQKNKVVELPEQELNKIRRRRHNPVKIAVGTLSAAIVTFVIGVIIVGQVQLTELNQKIISAKDTLADTESIYIQNQMKVETNLSKNYNSFVHLAYFHYYSSNYFHIDFENYLNFAHLYRN